MKKIYLFLWLLPALSLLVSCGNAKKIAENISQGHYDHAIDMAVKHLAKKRNTKSADKYALLLHEAYVKANERDLREIKRLQAEKYPERWEKIYQHYVALMDRQDKIRPLLPLRLVKENRSLNFDMPDYMPQLREARNHMVDVKYRQAVALMRKNTRDDYRKAYDLLEHIDEVYPGYKDVRQRMETAHNRGISYVGVVLENQSGKIIPKKLQSELLDFDGNRANSFWTVFEPAGKDLTQYDYLVKLVFTGIQVTPEKEQEKIVDQERMVQDGWEYARDQNGKILKDKNGKPVKQPHYIKVRARVHQYIQHKEALVQAEVRVYSLPGKKKITSQILQSRFVFDNRYLRVNGDKRALSDELAGFINNVRKPFPSNEQMVYDAGQDLKKKFSDLLHKAEFP